MRVVFADAFFWIALIEPSDSWHERARGKYLEIQPCKLVTTDEIFCEVLNFYAGSGPYRRKRAISFIKAARQNPYIDVQPQTRQSILAGEDLYERRSDKGFSLADCISMNTMRERNIIAVLTHDKHFSQEGFSILFEKEQ